MVQISRSTLHFSRQQGGAGGAHGERAGGDRESSSSSSAVRRRHYCGTSRAFRRGLLGLLRFLFMSAFIPSLFVIRYYWFSDSDSGVVNNFQTFEPSKTTSNAGSGSGGSSRSNGQQQPTEQQTNSKAAANDKERQQMFAFLNEIDFSGSSSSNNAAATKHRALQESDIVELDHCRIHAVDMDNFTTWAFPLVNDTVTQLLLLYQNEPAPEVGEDDGTTTSSNHAATTTTTTVPVLSYNKMTSAQRDDLRMAMQQEFVLELLEMYAHHAGYCQFSNDVYHPTVPTATTNRFTQRAVTRLRAVEQQYAFSPRNSPSDNNNNRRRVVLLDTDDDNVNTIEQEQQQQQKLRLVISIMAFKDVDQLLRLVQAVHMPQHYIIIHVEQRASLQFVEAIQQEILNDDVFDNVVLLKFGTIVYRTDSVSMTNLRIMRWITMELQLDYDYYVTLDGSSFPLQHAHDLQLTGAQQVRGLTALSSDDENNNIAEDSSSGMIHERVRFLDQESPSANIDGQATMDDDATFKTDSSPHAQHDETATDITNDDIGIENDPATVESGTSVWLGALLHKGVTVDSPQWHYLLQKRLIFTRHMVLADRDASSSSTTAASAALSYPKLHKRLPRSVSAALASSSPSVPSEIIRSHMTKKSISGNQGIFRRNVVQQLLTSPDAMELFALSKYACCCCVEERNWIAALGIISSNSRGDGSGSTGQQQGRPSTSVNYQQEALRQSSTFELWGGEGNACVSSMKNAVLTRNASICYKIDDERLVQVATGSATSPKIADTTTSPTLQHYFYGNATWSYLKLAKSKGYFFARKFDSSQPQSMDLLNDIQSELWEQG